MRDDLISKQAALDALGKDPMGGLNYESILGSLPSIQTERLTDAEQRIFLKAIEREEEVCKKVDEEWGSGGEVLGEISLVHVCHEIIRKVKSTLWT